MTTVAYTLTDSTLSLFLNGKPHIVPSSHMNFDEIKTTLREGRYDELADLIDVRQAIETYALGYVKIEGDTVFFDGQPLHTTLTDRLLEMYREGFDIDPMVHFLHNLMQNPSYRAVNELYDFLEATKLPITSDGHFIAYKGVREDYKDCHSGTFDNSVGQFVTMPRNQVDEDKHRTCSRGLHVASYNYAKGFYGSAGRLMAVKVNPRDVVAVPTDYNNEKMRVCAYEVIAETDTLVTGPVNDGVTQNYEVYLWGREYDETERTKITVAATSLDEAKRKAMERVERAPEEYFDWLEEPEDLEVTGVYSEMGKKLFPLDS